MYLKKDFYCYCYFNVILFISEQSDIILIVSYD